MCIGESSEAALHFTCCCLKYARGMEQLRATVDELWLSSAVDPDRNRPAMSLEVKAESDGKP